MNKYLFTLALAAPAVVLVSCSKTPESVTSDMADEIEYMATQLDKCDSSNADSIAADLEKSTAKFKELKNELDEMRSKDPSSVDNMKNKKELEDKMEKALAHFMRSAMTVSFRDCFGSEALKKALQNM